MKKDRVKKKIADIFDFPQDIVLDLPRITVIGNVQLYLENHRGITLYEKDKIRISVLNGEVVVHGEDLFLKTVYNDDIYIEGKIKNIELEGSIR